MATVAFYDGRKAGYYGNVKSANPYRKGWARLVENLRADDWERGYDDGEQLRTASHGDLLRALDNLGNLVTTLPHAPQPRARYST